MATKIQISSIRYTPPFLKINFQKVDIQMFITTFLLILGVLSKEMTKKSRARGNKFRSKRNKFKVEAVSLRAKIKRARAF